LYTNYVKYITIEPSEISKGKFNNSHLELRVTIYDYDLTITVYSCELTIANFGYDLTISIYSYELTIAII
jgi:hypothetical protein